MKRVILYIVAMVLLFPLQALSQGVEKVKDSKVKYTNIIDMLRGEPGVTIVGSSDGGTMPLIYIRGIGTNSNSVEPLLVVDGIHTDNIMYLRPEDVYSITVIKDGTAAIYGMRGANGVIEIRTKSSVGSAEKDILF
ncbi:MAG: TonB-dependent receptor plug domain-containing protein [Bacteroidaceae bacterium]|jgi:TonB-dependent SusC/RagA subfamily outer membrane receptor